MMENQMERERKINWKVCSRHGVTNSRPSTALTHRRELQNLAPEPVKLALLSALSEKLTRRMIETASS